MNSNDLSWSLADFYLSQPDDLDPLTPSRDFLDWHESIRWATDLYEPRLLGAPLPRVDLSASGCSGPLINLASYNYLGLGTHPAVIRGARQALERFGTGACGSPMLSGCTSLHGQLEERMADFLGTESVLLFNGGFAGAMACIAGLMRRGDALLMDERAHLSLLDGARLSRARLYPFDHNSATSLEARLKEAGRRRRLIVVEGIYSMDGDMADLPGLLGVARRYDASLLIDEAHSILGCGPGGGGVAEHFGVCDRVGLRYGTFSKAFAGVGGFVGGARDTLDYLRLYANPYGFSCALPPAAVGGLLAALEVVAAEGEELRRRLWENADYFRTAVRHLGFDTGLSRTYVVPILVGSDRRRLYELGHELRRKGLFLAPVDYPSVPADQVRFRASITAAHTRRDLDEALDILRETVQ